MKFVLERNTLTLYFVDSNINVHVFDTKSVTIKLTQTFL